MPDVDTIEQRTELGRALIARGTGPDDVPLGPAGQPPLARHLPIAFPDGLAPTPAPLAALPDPEAALPHADVVVVTWTVDEHDALCDVLTPGVGRKAWYPYTRRFADYAPRIRAGAPAATAKRLGSYFPTTIGSTSVLCFKSELHLNQDGVRTGDGTATLPVKDLFLQIVAEVDPKVVLTIGTSGSVFGDFQLGDVVVTRAAKFRLASEFRNEKFNGDTFTSDWVIPTSSFDAARTLMGAFAGELREPPFLPPTKNYHYHGSMIHPDDNVPDIKLDGRDMPAFHPILTTDYFEYGTSANRLDPRGSGGGDGRRGARPRDVGTRPPSSLGRRPEHVGSSDQRRHPGRWVPAERADALGGRVLRELRVLDERHGGLGDLGDHRGAEDLRVSQRAPRLPHAAPPARPLLLEVMPEDLAHHLVPIVIPSSTAVRKWMPPQIRAFPTSYVRSLTGSK